MIRPHKKFDGVFWSGKDLATLNLVPGQQVYGEKLIRDDREYRIWDPTRSKLAAAILKRIKKVPINSGSKVLYLGTGSGTTASHISDIVLRGVIYGVDIAPRVMRDFVLLCETRKNLIPILGDSRKPDQYSSLVEEVDIIYEDVAQRDQAEIMLKNARLFLKRGGYGLIMVKARSIDAVERPRRVYRQVAEKLREGFNIIDIKELDPYERDHAAILGKWM